jgi:hypothetical protein
MDVDVAIVNLKFRSVNAGCGKCNRAVDANDFIGLNKGRRIRGRLSEMFWGDVRDRTRARERRR